jgi:hypothetical protein
MPETNPNPDVTIAMPLFNNACPGAVDTLVTKPAAILNYFPGKTDAKMRSAIFAH